MSHVENLFLRIPPALPAELCETLLDQPGARIERIVSRGHASADGFWFDQETAEWVLLLAGAARLQFEGEEPLTLRPGDYIFIPAHRRHRVEWTAPDADTVWLAVHVRA